MKNFWIFSLFFFCGLTAYKSYAIQHNLFYGHCTYDNNTMPIYTQLIAMDNPRPSVSSKPVRRWYDFFSNISFRRRTTTTTTPPPPPQITSGNIINATVVFPPAGHKNAHLIKCIQVIDNIRDGSGASASVIDGGVNQNRTVIFLKSQPGGKINAKVTIFAYRNTDTSYQQTPFGWKLNMNPNQIPNSQPNKQQNQYQSQQQKPMFLWPTF